MNRATQSSLNVIYARGSKQGATRCIIVVHAMRDRNEEGRRKLEIFNFRGDVLRICSFENNNVRVNGMQMQMHSVLVLILFCLPFSQIRKYEHCFADPIRSLLRDPIQSHIPRSFQTRSSRSFSALFIRRFRNEPHHENNNGRRRCKRPKRIPTFPRQLCDMPEHAEERSHLFMDSIVRHAGACRRTVTSFHGFQTAGRSSLIRPVPEMLRPTKLLEMSSRRTTSNKQRFGPF